MSQLDNQQVRKLYARFLWPFLIEPEKVDSAWDQLHARPIADRRVTWVSGSPLALYRDELLEMAHTYLFGDRDRYCSLSEESAEALIPRGLIAKLSKGVTAPVAIQHTNGIEMFLTRDGLGVLSITLGTNDVPATVAIDFIYRLSLVCGAPPAKLYLAHPSDNEGRWARIPEAVRERIQPAPTVDDPAVARIGRAGGTFTLAEVVEQLMEPLTELGARRLQSRMSVYSVAAFDSTVVFDQEKCMAWAGPLVSALAQIEEPTHAGAPAGPLAMANGLMNRCHWAAVGLSGAAHLVADQPPPQGFEEHPFNSERISRVRDKYFIPYLLALVQRLVLNRMAEHAINLAHSGERERLRDLRTSLLQFGIAGRFSQVSARQALHRYYRIAQEGLDVREAWNDVRSAIADVDAVFSEDRERSVAKDISNNLTVITNLQHAAHALEYVIISVYCAHLWHMFASDNEHLYIRIRSLVSPLIPAGSVFPPRDWFVAWGVAAFAMTGWFLAYQYNRWRSKRAAESARGRS